VPENTRRDMQSIEQETAVLMEKRRKSSKSAAQNRPQSQPALNCVANVWQPEQVSDKAAA
jgi:hypothetical protein